MNIYQKKINKQSNLFKEFHSSFWKLNNYSFNKARIEIRIINKENLINSIELINREIKEIKDALNDFKGVILTKK